MENINKLQELLAQKDIDAYIITSNDDHFSEYVPEHYKSIEFLTNFTGEAATLIVTKTSALLWVDGRFFIQADIEVTNKDITIIHEKEHNNPSPLEYLESHLFEAGNIALDGKLVSKKMVDAIKEKLPKSNIISADLITDVWENRPAMPFSLVYVLENFFSGETYENKLEAVRRKLIDKKANALIISELDCQAWLFNLRGNDIEYSPLFLAFTVITNDSVHLFIDNKKITDEVKKYLNENDVKIDDYDSFYTYVSALKGNKILTDLDSTSYTVYRSISSNNEIILDKNPINYLKSIKNNIEILNSKQAHVKDGVAMVKAIYKLYQDINSYSEITFADMLEEERKKQKGYISLSFPTIAGFKENGAIVHYTAKEGSEHMLNDEEKTFFLVDSGAHYAEGTTDITRTFALGSISDEMSLHYTSVLKSHIALASATFLKGCHGSSLDVLARTPLWKIGLNFNHGTGHGVGHILSVHEGPQRISFQSGALTPIEPGMITTDEPGLYIEKKYGIRIENELLCTEAFNNEFGHFYKFEVLTLCPIDTKAINLKLLTYEEKEWINSYHKKVYNSLYSYLTKEEVEWLLEATKDIE